MYISKYCHLNSNTLKGEVPCSTPPHSRSWLWFVGVFVHQDKVLPLPIRFIGHLRIEIPCLFINKGNLHESTNNKENNVTIK